MDSKQQRWVDVEKERKARKELTNFLSVRSGNNKSGKILEWLWGEEWEITLYINGKFYVFMRKTLSADNFSLRLLRN